ncbi:MAG: hypothetical protein DRP70_10880 [Spirochaetes bacterium]|nr:MAG: hypothetical protein DRP70_10880 [Spirochaetota bacterium]
MNGIIPQGRALDWSRSSDFSQVRFANPLFPCSAAEPRGMKPCFPFAHSGMNKFTPLISLGNQACKSGEFRLQLPGLSLCKNTDVTNTPVEVPIESEATCLGAAIIEAVDDGFDDGLYNSFENTVEEVIQKNRRFNPNHNKAMKKNYQKFNALYTAALEVERTYPS